MRRILYSHSQTNVFIRGAFMGSSPKPQHRSPPPPQERQQSHRQRVYRRSWNTVWRSEMLVFLTILIVNACLAGTIPATPENITVSFLTPTTVRVSWQTLIDLNAHPVEKYIVTYKPTNDRVVQDVAGNSKATILDRLTPNTQYSVAVTAIWLGKKYRSRPVVFRTLDLPPKVPPVQHDVQSTNGLKASNARPPSPTDGLFDDDLALAGGVGIGDDVTSTATNTLPHGRHRELPTIRGVEIGIVLIVLMVWAGAIALFFNRWGKIRMLLPYQPDYKHEQLKVPGTGVCSGGVCNGQHSHQNIHPDMFVKFDSSECGALAYQPLHCSSRHFHMLQEEHSSAISERCTRSRINSAIFVSSEGRGFDSIEFLRRHGSQSVLCRKYRSAENITDNERKKNFAEKRQWRTDESAECIAENGTDTEEAAEGEGGGGAGAGGHLSTSSTNIGLHEAALRSVAVVKALTAIGPDSSVVTCQPTSSAGTGPPALPLPPGSTGTITTSNMIVGSISIEAPPAYIKDELAAAAAAAAAAAVMPTPEPPQQHAGSSIKSAAGFTNATSSSHESNDTVEELIVVATEPCPARPRSLVHQQRSLECAASPHPSPKALHLRGVKPKIVTLPMVSVSGPSPPHEKPPPSECL